MSDKIRVGGEIFSKIRRSKSYYVDKTAFIEEFFETGHADVTLITRPRRFGKTVMLSALSDFFDIRKESGNLFYGLDICLNTEICALWMNQYPTIFLTLKEFRGQNFQKALNTFKVQLAGYTIKNFAFLLDSPHVISFEKNKIERIMCEEANPEQMCDFLSLLIRCLKIHYNKNVIVLIDEYDVPLTLAHEHGYYTEMLDFMRTMLGSALKTNEDLEFAILSGCLRISKESIFTGWNNFTCYGVSEMKFQDRFGFTEQEVNTLLSDAGISDKQGEIKEWYDGYIFGDDQKIYCPWDFVYYVNTLMRNPKANPKNYWTNTSSNALILEYLEKTTFNIKDKFERLISQGYISVRINETMTYNEIYLSEDNFWTILYLTGYLTKLAYEKAEAYGLTSSNEYTYLVIPNREIRSIFADSAKVWFTRFMKTYNRDRLFTSFWEGNTDVFHEEVTTALLRSISYFDYDENFYHAFITGIFYGSGYTAESNREGGTGRMDICVRYEERGRMSVIEIKHTDDMKYLSKAADTALEKIEEKKYDFSLQRNRRLLRWGLAFCKKFCEVRCKIIRQENASSIFA